MKNTSLANRGIRDGHVEIHATKTGGFKVYILGTHPDFIRAWQGWSGICRHTLKGQPMKGFEKIEKAIEFCKVLFPSAEAFDKYARTAPSTKMSDSAADDFCETDVLTIYRGALVPLEEMAMASTGSFRDGDQRGIDVEQRGGKWFLYADDSEVGGPYDTEEEAKAVAERIESEQPTREEEPAEEPMTADAVAAAITDLIETDRFEEVWAGHDQKIEMESFRSAGVLTNDAGFVLKIGSSEYQVTVVRSR